METPHQNNVGQKSCQNVPCGYISMIPAVEALLSQDLDVKVWMNHISGPCFITCLP